MPSPGITKKALADAMKQLMRERPLAKINVNDIVGLCGLNRNSFYYHFMDKYDLVNWIFYTEIAEEFTSKEVENESGWSLIQRICQYFYDNRDFYVNALSVSGQNSFSEYYMEVLKTLISTRSDDLFVNDNDEDRDFYFNFFADAFAATTFRWLRDGAKIPPDKFADLIKKAATGAAIKVLQDSDDSELI